jgi:PAS domain S-box-containing protein
MNISLLELQNALGLQASLTIFLVLLFALLYRRLGREPFFGWWTAAWAGFGGFLLAAGASLGVAPSPLRSALVLSSVLLGLGYLPFIVAGVRALDRPELSQRRPVIASLGFLGALAVATYAVSVSVDAEPVVRAMIRAVPRLLLGSLALGFAAVTLRRRAMGSGSTLLLAGVCAIWAVEQLLYAVAAVRRIAQPRTDALAWLPDIGEILSTHWAMVDVLWQVGIALALVLLLLERHERAGARLHAATSERRALIEAAPLAIVSLDTEGRVRTWNPAAEALLGWTAAEVVGRPLPIIRDEDVESSRAFRARLLGGDVVMGREAVYRRKDGREVTVLESAAPLRDSDGRIDGLTRMMADLTQLRTTEAQLRQAQKMEAVGRLAGGVAHDFNNLLTAILSTAEVASAELPPEHPVRADLATIAEAGTRAAALTRQLLAFSRQQVLQPERFDPNELVVHLHALLARVIGADVTLALDLAPLRSHVRADRNQLEQALTNLVVNARDALSAGGTITIATRDAAFAGPHAGTIAEIPAGDYVVLSVRDDGTGMEPEVLRRAFEPFYTTKEPGRGTGLGLAMVYGFVQQSGGSLDVESAPGSGTTMTIYLPGHVVGELAESGGEDAAGTGPLQSAADGRARATVLVAEDDHLVRELTRTLLAARGYKVLVAENGRAALELAEAHGGPIDLLLTDVVMPEMGGPELERRLRARHPGLRVLFMSGYVDESVVGPGALSQDADLVEKPFTANALAERIEAALARR